MNVRHGIVVLETIRVAPASGGSQKSLVLFDLWLRLSDFCLLLHMDVLSCRGRHHLYQPPGILGMYTVSCQTLK